jgi:NAD(P)-dependent dehydrogenase (short-subunit alcohol dehydrogenase family)
MSEGVMRAIVVTGCSTGIGKACALRLAREGYTVFAGVRREEDGRALEAESSGGIRPLLLDVTNAAQIAAAVLQVESALGANGELAGLINNAGVAVYGPLELLPIERLRSVFEVNVIGHVAVTQAFIPLLRLNKGRVVMIGSSSGFLTPPFLGPYASSKCAMESITDAFRRELAPWGIEVCIMQPGAVRTPLWDKSVGEGDSWFDSLPETARRLYARGYTAMRKTFVKKSGKGIATEALADRVLEALTSAKPRARYPMGRDTVGYRILQKLPDKMVDNMLGPSLEHTHKHIDPPA